MQENQHYLSVITAAQTKNCRLCIHHHYPPDWAWLNTGMEKVFALPICRELSKALPKEKDWAIVSYVILNAILSCYFLIPADSNDHKKEFEILLNELEEYNPELLHKQFIIAISKTDMLDDELKAAIEKELPQNIPHIFISSITQKGLIELKDLLWKTLNVSTNN